jgi:ComF family protein
VHSRPVVSPVARILDVAFPARCPGCGREGDPICQSCVPRLATRLEMPPGVPIGLPSGTPPPLVQLEWCAPYQGVVRAALHDLKYGGEERLAGPLGRAIAARWRRAGVGGDVIVPVPVHAERRRRRGYDQAELIARVAGANLRLPVLNALVRARATAAQFDLDRRHRATNVRDAFGLSDARPVVGIRGRWVVLVDDVTTTGATLSACAAPLLAAGATAVSAVVVARER